MSSPISFATPTGQQRSPRLCRKERAPRLHGRVCFCRRSEPKRDRAEDESYASAAGRDRGDGGGRRSVALPQVRIQEHRVDSIDVDERRVGEGLMKIGAMSAAHDLGCAAPTVASQE